MSVTRIVALFATVASVSTGSLQAQTGQVPAEFPPASYAGMQYVDSTGCVFIRAGIDGNTTWVPRVNRQRRQVCGQTPSLSSTAIANARPSQPAAEAPVQITIESPAAAEPVPSPAATPTTRQATRTQPAPVRRPAPVAVAPRPAPAPVVRAAPQPAPQVATVAEPPAPVAANAPRTATAAPACQGASALSQRYINSGTRSAVRCGPQGVSPTAGAVSRSAQASAPVLDGGAVGQVTTSTRVLPRQVFDARLQERDVAQVPHGYRRVWTDDRLNPRRAEQSLGGMAKTRLVWTQTVPRRLVDQATGRDVTARVALVYPYTDVDTQKRELGTVTLVRRDGQLLKRIQRNRAKARTPVAEPQAKAAPAPRAASVAAAAPKAAVKGRYVQVGTFGVSENAQKTAQRLVRAGVPARIGTLTRSGKSYRVVLAGPFDTRNGLNSGLQAARSMGFSDAFIR